MNKVVVISTRLSMFADQKWDSNAITNDCLVKTSLFRKLILQRRTFLYIIAMISCFFVKVLLDLRAGKKIFPCSYAKPGGAASQSHRRIFYPKFGVDGDNQRIFSLPY